MSAVLLLRPGADLAALHAELHRRGLSGQVLRSDERAAVLVSGPARLEALPGVEHVLSQDTPHPRVEASSPIVDVGGVAVGGPELVIIAGPCAVEAPELLEPTVAAVAEAGAQIVRGGAFKPRTSPYSFQGLGEPGLDLLRRAADRHGLKVVTEAMAPADVPAVADHAELLQIGARNMQNFALLKAAGRCGRPVLLKRGPGNKVDEWLLAAEYLLDAGAPGVLLCERGIQAMEQPTRYTLDLGSAAYLLEHQPLPVVVDPSHASGRRELVPRLARAAVAMGAAAVMVEVHVDPSRARSDAPQALLPLEFARLATELRRLASTLGRPDPARLGSTPLGAFAT